MKQKKIISSEKLADTAVNGLQEKKANDIVVMDLRGVKGAISDFFVICSATSDRHAQTLCDSVEDMVRKELNDKPMSIEGRNVGEWVLLDYVDVVVHIFLQEKRDFFDIEGLWGDAGFKSIA